MGPSESPDDLLPLPAAVFHILVALADRDRHGYSIMQDVGARTDGKVVLSAGTLYTAVRRMLEQGLIQELRESPDPDSGDERRRYYRLTQFGRDVAVAELEVVLAGLAREAAETLEPLVGREQAPGFAQLLDVEARAAGAGIERHRKVLDRVRGGGSAGRTAYSSISLMTTLSPPSISASLTPITSFLDVGTFLPT